MDSKKGVVRTAVLFAVFVLFTVLVCKLDVKAIGPQGSSVGFAGINGLVAKMFPYSGTFYKVSKLLGYLAILVCVFFAFMGLLEFLRKKNLGSVSNGILMLGALYVCLAVFYVLFAKVVGSLLPIAAEKIGVDPAVMANPLISTLTDAVSLLIYIYIARLILHI